jgi:uncharacterized membrane protein HdeD (DUF308 family)
MADQALLTSGQRGALRIALGVISVLLGLAALLWPGVTLLVVAMLFGLELIAAGLVRIVAGVTLSALPGWWRAMSGILGVLTVLAGIICLVRPGASLFVLAAVIAIGWFLDGASELVSAFTVSRRATERLGLIAFGLVSIVAALVVFSSPGDSLVILARIGGVILLVFGVVTLFSVFAGRGQRSTDAATSAPAR